MINYEKLFSNNIKRLRMKEGFTQKAFAEKIGYSEKAVSKWETGHSIPSIHVLFEIANILKVGIEELFCDDENTFFLGIDGGGTKTKLCLTDGEGKEINSIVVGPSNPFDIGIEASQTLLKSAIYEVCKDVHLSSVVLFAGLAGGISGENRRVYAEFFKAFNFKAVYNGSDIDNIIAAGLGEGDGIAVIMGTGICIYSIKDGKYNRFSGWGFHLDKGGSAYNIGRDALSAAFSYLDGSGEKTLLLKMVEEKTNKPMEKLVTDIYEGGKAYIASFSEIVFDAAEKGDRIAADIINRNVNEVVRLLRVAVKPFADDVRVVVAGGLSNQKVVIDKIKEALENEKKYNIEVLKNEPVYGALFLARSKYKK